MCLYLNKWYINGFIWTLSEHYTTTALVSVLIGPFATSFVIRSFVPLRCVKPCYTRVYRIRYLYSYFETGLLFSLHLHGFSIRFFYGIRDKVHKNHLVVSDYCYPKRSLTQDNIWRITILKNKLQKKLANLKLRQNLIIRYQTMEIPFYDQILILHLSV